MEEQPYRIEVCKGDGNEFGVVLRDIREEGFRSMDSLPRVEAIGLARSLDAAEKDIPGLFDGEWSTGKWRGAPIDGGKAREYLERNPGGNVLADAFGQREHGTQKPGRLASPEVPEKSTPEPSRGKRGPDIDMDR